MGTSTGAGNVTWPLEPARQQDRRSRSVRVSRKRLRLGGLLLVAVVLPAVPGALAAVGVIPKPNQMAVDEQAPPFKVTSSTRILY